VFDFELASIQEERIRFCLIRNEAVVFSIAVFGVSHIGVSQVVRLVKINIYSMSEQAVGLHDGTLMLIFMQHPKRGFCTSGHGQSVIWGG